MKRVQAEFPFEDYWLYIVIHKKEKRRMANLIRKNTNSLERKTISYARYLMCVSLGRILTEVEHVDHIDDNSMNDSLDNFQILTPEQNMAKQAAKIKANIVYLELNCSGCSKLFKMTARNYKSRSKTGNTRFFCTCDCYRRLGSSKVEQCFHKAPDVSSILTLATK